MKVYISADIEGCADVTAWCETESGQEGYESACRQMTLETAAACEAAIEMGYTPVVKDGHGNARNIDPWGLPRGTQLIRGWRTSPAGMMGGLDDTFAAAIYIGYHAPEGTDGSPLAHTIEHEWFMKLILNDQLESEFTLNALYAANFGVPSVFIAGDKAVCEHAAQRCPHIITLPVKEGTGSSTWSMHPQDAASAIKAGVKESLQKISLIEPRELIKPEYKLDLYFKEHRAARAAAWYPGAERIDTTHVRYVAKDVMELMIAKMFMTEI